MSFLGRTFKKSFLLAILIFIPSAFVSAKVVERIIAVVDGEPYTLTNVASYAITKMGREFPAGDLNQINVSDREVLEQFLTEKLLEAEIRQTGIKVTDEKIDQYIEHIKARNRLSDEDLKTALSREGHTIASYRASVKSELEKSEITNRQVREKVNITDDDVERYYKLNSKQYRSDERARLRHILLLVAEDAAPEQVQAVMAKSTELYRRVAAGEDFAALAKQFSEGAGADEGGDIGWVRRGALIAGLEEVAFNKLSVGQASEPFRTSMGVHIVKLEARENGNLLPLSTVAPKIKEELYTKALEERFEKWLKTDLRRKHRVEVKIAGVVFKPEDSKEGMVDSLMAKSMQTNRRQEKTFLSYLNPFSYFVKEVPLEDDDATGPLTDKKIVTVFGVPLFTTDTVEDVPSDVLAPPQENAQQSDPAPAKSGGFFSSIVDSLNPFKP